MDRQRSAVQKYFFPSSYTDQKMFVFNESKPRTFQNMNIRIDFVTCSQIRLFYRSKGTLRNMSKYDDDIERCKYEYKGPNGDAQSVKRQSDYLTLNIQSGSYSKIVIPWICTSQEGTNTEISFVLNGADITVGRKNFSFIEIPQNDNFIDDELNNEQQLQHPNSIQVSMNYPVKWNGLSKMNVNVNLQSPKIYFLYEYINHITDLLSDWGNSNEYPDLRVFVPSTMHFDLHLTDSTLITYVNKDNVIDVFPDIIYNNTISFSIPNVEVSFDNPSLHYHERETIKVFSVKMNGGEKNKDLSRKVVAYISHPVSHPLSQIMNGSDMNKESLNEIMETHSINIEGKMTNISFLGGQNVSPGCVYILYYIYIYIIIETKR